MLSRKHDKIRVAPVLFDDGLDCFGGDLCPPFGTNPLLQWLKIAGGLLPDSDGQEFRGVKGPTEWVVSQVCVMVSLGCRASSFSMMSWL
jgi:hypothetical protein